MEGDYFVDEFYSVETDEEYEFDASQFYDFTRLEIDSEIEEVERWFEVSGDYPHSPFVVKLNLEKILCPEVVLHSSAEDSKNTKSIISRSDINSRQRVSHSKTKTKEKRNPMLQDTAKYKTIPADKVSQPRSSTFMELTASHLAKQHKLRDQKYFNICTRYQRTLARLEQKNSSVGSDNLATKRQKLETGYLKKVTIPRKLELETQLRAQRQRSKNGCASSETEKQKQKGCNFKAHPLNRKILQTHLWPQQRKRKPQSPEFQVFHSTTLQRANHHSSAKENRFSSGDKLLGNQLIGQFTELSLGSNLETECISVKKAFLSQGMPFEAKSVWP